jgi:hypothetical protein
MAPRMSAEAKRYAAEDALRTLTRAAEIKGDKALMKMVQAHAKKQISTVAKVVRGAGTTQPKKSGKPASKTAGRARKPK